jgi:hypothetical protein
MSFHDDLERGLDAERQFLAKLQKKYPCAVIVNAHKGYDIWIPEIGKSVEVKADYESKKTKQWLIEVQMSGKPSGLVTSTADVWVFTDGEKWLSVAKNDLIAHILMTGYLLQQTTGFGDKNSKLCYFIPNVVMESLCQKIR